MIVSDDLPGSINDISVAEGDSGSKLATFTITRSDASITSSVAWALALTGSADKADVVQATIIDGTGIATIFNDD